MLPVTYTAAAKKYFKKLKDQKLLTLYYKTISAIRLNPYCGKAKSGDLKGLYSIDVYYGGNNYELAYRIVKLENNKIIVVIMAGTRENFYKELKRYIK